MRNVLAIAGREWRAYFASPIAYFVVGLFALLFGWFYFSILVLFVDQSLRMGGMGMGGAGAPPALPGLGGGAMPANLQDLMKKK